MTIKVIVPEATENLIENPSFELDTTGWTTNGSALTRVLTRARFGIASGQVVTTGAVHNEGVYYRIDPDTQGEPYAGSVYIRGSGIVRIRVRDGFNGHEWVSESIALSDNKWRRLEVVGFTRGDVSDDIRLYIETATNIQAITFYIDAAQLENKYFPTSYCDGDIEESIEPHHGYSYFRWEGARHNSTSKRSERYSGGGRWKAFEDVDVNLYPISGGGLGMGSVRLGIQQFSDQIRSIVRTTRPQPRVVTMTFWTRQDENSHACTPVSLKRLNDARQELEALVKPDRTSNVQPIKFRWEDNGRSIDFEGYYETGLEFGGDFRFPYFNSFPVRLLCPDPYAKEDSQDVQNLTPVKGVPDADYIIAKIDGEWQVPGDGAANDDVFAIGVSPNGDVYVGGEFTQIGGLAINRIARWDGNTYHPLAVGVDDGTVRYIAFGADGTVYVGGTFTNIGGVAHTNIASYDPATDTWATMGPGPGLSHPVHGIGVTDDGQVWVAGQFTSDNAGLTLNSAARYDPDADTFNTMGGGGGAIGLNDSPFHVIPDLNGYDTFWCGRFDNIFGGAASSIEGVCRYNRDDDAFEACGTGVDTNGNVDYTFRMAMSRGGKIYICGNTDHAGYLDVDQVAMYNRQEWYALGQEGDGLDPASVSSRWVAVEPRTGHIWFVGDFTYATGADLARAVVVWNQTRFSHVDLNLPPTAKTRTIAFHGDDVWIGHATAGNADASYVHTINNRGKATTKPVLEMTGPAEVWWLENQTTGQIIRMDLTILEDERIIIDFREGLEKAWSSLRGYIQRDILAGSDTFELLPGENKVAFMALEYDVNSEFSLRWDIRHWGFDGSA